MHLYEFRIRSMTRAFANLLCPRPRGRVGPGLLLVVLSSKVHRMFGLFRSRPLFASLLASIVFGGKLVGNDLMCLRLVIFVVFLFNPNGSGTFLEYVNHERPKSINHSIIL